MTTHITNRDYGKLPAKALSRGIKSEEENNRILRSIETLMSKGEANMTAEENSLPELLAGLVQEYESTTHEPLPQSEPHELVQFLFDQRQLQPKDLWPIPGSKLRVSEILSGRRSVSKLQVEKLGEFFSVCPAIFL